MKLPPPIVILPPLITPPEIVPPVIVAVDVIAPLKLPDVAFTSPLKNALPLVSI